MSRLYKRGTSYGKHNACERNKSSLFVALKEEVDVIGVESFEYSWIELHVVRSNRKDTDKPGEDNGWKQEWNSICPKTLDAEKGH